jgi:hypothetical protein
MIHELKSKDNNFLTRTNAFHLRLSLMIPLFGLALAAMSNNELGVGHGKLEKILNGLSHMRTSSIILTLVIFLLVAAMTVMLVKSNFENRELVIGVKFNDEQKTITVTTKTVGGVEYVRTHNYHELKLKEDKISDGMFGSDHNTVTLVKTPYLVGHIFIDHFSWDNHTQQAMLNKLRNVISSSDESRNIRS